MDYEEAARIMTVHAERVRRGRGVVARCDPHRKKLKNQTWLITYESDPQELSYALQYFATEIISYSTTGVHLHDGGFFSRSTHDRFNEFLPRGYRVYGTTYKELGLHRPLGFVKTPAGVYPYCLPMSFDNEGKPLDALCPNANEAVRTLTTYVDNYLTKLLKKEKCDITGAADAARLWETRTKWSAESLSETFGKLLTSGTTYTFLLMLIGRYKKMWLTTNMAPQLSLEEIGHMLAYEGGAIYKSPRTNAEHAARMEHTLEYEMKIPKFNLGKLRAKLRRVLIDFFIEQLGFSEVEWHRRQHNGF